MEYQENKYFVYALIDPINNTPFYFGKGCGDRPKHHLDGRDKHNTHKDRIINIIRLLGHEPKIGFVQEGICEDYAYELETFCINEARKMGLMITNKTGLKKPPSRKGKTLSLETKLKISKATKGRIGRILSDETKEKLRSYHKGILKSDEFKKRVSEGLKRAWKEGRFVRK